MGWEERGPTELWKIFEIRTSFIVLGFGVGGVGLPELKEMFEILMIFIVLGCWVVRHEEVKTRKNESSNFSVRQPGYRKKSSGKTGWGVG